MKQKQISVDYTNKFKKQLKKAPLEIKKAFSSRLELMKQDLFHPLLNNHSLIGKFKGYRSINITGDWRAIYSRLNGLVVFEMLGTHS